MDSDDGWKDTGETRPQSESYEEQKANRSGLPTWGWLMWGGVLLACLTSAGAAYIALSLEDAVMRVGVAILCAGVPLVFALALGARVFWITVLALTENSRHTRL